MSAKRKIVFGLIVLLTVILLAVVWWTRWPPSSVHAVFTSPSGNYRLVVRSYYRLFSLPGDSSGSPGYVELFDRGGNKLAEAKVPLVLDVSSPDDIRWYDHDVVVPGVFDFPISHP